MLNYTTGQQKEIEKAVSFMVSCLSKNCNNKKPVILHSIRVGMKLMEMNQPEEVVKAGFLHDLLEDSNCLEMTIKNEFGEKVLVLVKALTFDISIKDYKKRWEVSLLNVEKAGVGAMTIKIIDQMDNLPYYMLISEEAKKQEVIWKHRFTIEKFAKYFPDNDYFSQYEEKVAEIVSDRFDNQCSSISE